MEEGKTIKARNVSCQVYTISGRQTSKDYVRFKLLFLRFVAGEIYKWKRSAQNGMIFT
jgi:hypothetical protein